MDAQTVSLESNNCDLYFLKCRIFSGDSENHIWAVCKNNARGEFIAIGGTSSGYTGGLWCGVRNFSISNHTSLTVEKSHSWGGSSWAETTVHVYPVEVYGVL